MSALAILTKCPLAKCPLAKCLDTCQYKGILYFDTNLKSLNTMPGYV